MASSQSSANVLKQAEHIWQMLDELADSDPAAYKKFIEKNMKDEKTDLAVPKPFICLETNMVLGQVEDNTTLFINICSWSKIPEPKTNADSISICGGPLEDRMLDTGNYKVTRVATSPGVLTECFKKQEEFKMLMNLVLKYLEEQHSLNISKNYLVCKQKYTGDELELRYFFEKKEKSANEIQAENLSNMSPESLIGELRKTSIDEDVKTGEDVQHLHLTRSNKDEHQKGKTLIEEISETNVTLPSPEHDLTLKEKDARKPRRLVLRISLPGVTSVKECELDITPKEINLHVFDKYNLNLSLPHLIQDQEVSAKFISKLSTLTVTMPLQ